MVARLLRFCLLGLLLTGCSSLPNLSSPWASDATSYSIPKVTPPAPTQIALLLPAQGDFANAAKAIQAGFTDEYQQSAYHPVIKVYDTSQGQSISSIYDEAVRDGANYVVGPLEKNNVASLENYNTKVVTIALNSADGVNVNPNFYQFPLSPIDEARQIADKAAQAGHRNALLITPAGKWGDSIADALQMQWQADGGRIVGRAAVSNSAALNNQVRQLLGVNGKTRRQDFDTIFLIAQPLLARQIQPLFKFYYAANIPVYSTSLIYTGIVNSKADNDLNGIMFCDMPLVLAQNGPDTQIRQQFTINEPGYLQQYVRLYGLGWDAALITQQLDTLNSGRINGVTGQLSLDHQGHITRQLDFAVFSNGIPVEMT